MGSTLVCGICGSDLKGYKDRDEPESLPAGHEVAGEIVEVGERVSGARVGERVSIDIVGQGLACFDCWYCRTGQYRWCERRATDPGGGFAGYLVRRAAGCYPLPDGLSWREGAMADPLAVSVHAVRRARMSPGETVVVLGAGTIGLTAVAASRALGAGKVYASARHPHQAALAKRLGADDVLPTESNALGDAVDELTGGRGADLTFETVGAHQTETMHQAIDVTRTQGRIVSMAGFVVPMTLDLMKPLLKEQSIIFASCYSVIDGRHDYEVALDLMESGRVDMGQLVTHTFTLADIQTAFDTAYDKSTGSVKVQVWPDSD